MIDITLSGEIHYRTELALGIALFGGFLAGAVGATWLSLVLGGVFAFLSLAVVPSAETVSIHWREAERERGRP